jgi:hypothetical protein
MAISRSTLFAIKRTILIKLGPQKITLPDCHLYRNQQRC